MERLFAYGTLQPGQRYFDEIADFVAYHEPASIWGFALYHLPGREYPAILPGEGVVRGTMIEFTPDAREAARAACDAIEGVHGDPDADEYVVSSVRAILTERTVPVALNAILYVYHPRLAEGLRRDAVRVADGNWLAHIAASS